MDSARQAEQTDVVGELTMLRFGFDFPHLLTGQGRQFLEQMTGFSAGLGDFLLRRGNRNIETATRLAQCKSLPDLFLLQTQWMRDAADDYMKEAARMSESNARMFGGSWKPQGVDTFFRTVRSDPPFASVRDTV
jgi:hypothetical protein